MLILDVGYAPLLNIKNDFDKMYLDGGALVKLGAAYRIPVSETISFYLQLISTRSVLEKIPALAAISDWVLCFSGLTIYT
ncbi:hypothetical protein LWM68_32075 [Niabella sp. W65]|nr:hypothetical protein [Niabella sp. W65]MCH7366998.1 hypothetical protein [Niabella sp. W65]ULT42683.1 hypothetical protein KRR40_03595 [Niabella sp. I65]